MQSQKSLALSGRSLSEWGNDWVAVFITYNAAITSIMPNHYQITLKLADLED